MSSLVMAQLQSDRYVNFGQIIPLQLAVHDQLFSSDVSVVIIDCAKCHYAVAAFFHVVAALQHEASKRSKRVCLTNIHADLRGSLMGFRGEENIDEVVQPADEIAGYEALMVTTIEVE